MHCWCLSIPKHKGTPLENCCDWSEFQEPIKLRRLGPFLYLDFLSYTLRYCILDNKGMVPSRQGIIRDTLKSLPTPPTSVGPYSRACWSQEFPGALWAVPHITVCRKNSLNGESPLVMALDEDPDSCLWFCQVHPAQTIHLYPCGNIYLALWICFL